MKKDKIGIMTLFDNLNYGATLQAYALQYEVKKLGWDCEDIRYFREIDHRPINDKSIYSKVHQLMTRFTNLDHQITQLCHYSKFRQAKKHAAIRDKAIKRFIKNKMNVSDEYYSGHKDIRKAVDKYDMFICGSDNIWNKNLLDTAFFLDFVPDDKPKIAYAPGMSTSSLTEKEQNIILPLINRFDSLSVREKMGQELLQRISNMQIENVLDPTLLLTRNEWEKMEKEVELPFDDYILCYFFGTNPVSRACAKKLAEKKNLPIVCLPMSSSYLKEDDGFGTLQLYDIEPSQFVWLIDHASYVCTDSFHGTTFSVLFQKEFFCFRRFFDEKTKSLNLRIDFLLNVVGIENRIIESAEGFCVDELPITDFEQAECRLSVERNKSLQYLKKALEKGNII